MLNTAELLIQIFYRLINALPFELDFRQNKLLLPIPGPIASRVASLQPGEKTWPLWHFSPIPPLQFHLFPSPSCCSCYAFCMPSRRQKEEPRGGQGNKYWSCLFLLYCDVQQTYLRSTHLGTRPLPTGKCILCVLMMRSLLDAWFSVVKSGDPHV